MVGEGESNELFRAGWDWYEYFTIGDLITCPNCSTTEYMMKNNLFEK